MAAPETPPVFKYKAGRPQLQSVCDALKATFGFVEPAARLLEMDASNLRKYVRSHPRCVAVQIEAKEKIKDLAESQLVQLLNAKDWRAVQFTLLTLAWDRGYSLPKGTALTGEVINSVTIGSVTVQPIASGHFYDDNGRLLGPGDAVIDPDGSSILGGRVIDNEPEKPA
jgi:hypothetical protein